MNPYVTLLERCGKTIIKSNFDGWWTEIVIHENGALILSDYRDDELKAYALEVGAQEAAEWLNEHDNRIFLATTGWWIASEDSAICNPATESTRWMFTNLELIQEATKEGWEKGEGLSL